LDTAVILLVEDRDDDVIVITKAFKAASLTNPIHAVRSGEEAIAYLSGEGKYSNRAEHPLPLLVLLDLKLPGIDGFEVLSWIRRQEGIRAMPVLVLTCSNQLKDINRAYHLGANSFFVKEFDFQNTVEFGKLLRTYWLHTALPPQTSRPAPTPTHNPWRP